ncbi:MAG: hypothetical protein VR65_24850 [Desulfobulbaceae bacterium BRH_c16a]|nr:MAG: hypothetical protein VR65_24850 [Desulfobulbaceae bacterium BRH_c16a]
MADDHARILREFLLACSETPEKIKPINNVLADARYHYKIQTKPALIDLIANNGLEQLSFDKKKVWKKNFTDHHPLFVYSFKFKTLHLPGYIAIIENKMLGNWLIKSFHPPTKGSNPTLADKFQNLIGQPEE